jgi:hypothetical protein
VTKLASREIAELDPCEFMAVIGKRVIHPGGPACTESLLRRGSINEPSTAQAVPYLGYIVVAGANPR